MTGPIVAERLFGRLMIFLALRTIELTTKRLLRYHIFAWIGRVRSPLPAQILRYAASCLGPSLPERHAERIEDHAPLADDSLGLG